jgi:hypothetical protein
MARMDATELAARRYIDAWFEPDRTRRARLLRACFAAEGRITVGGRVIRGRRELAAAIDGFRVDPRELRVRLSSPVEAAGPMFRFRALFVHPDGEEHSELIDIGEVDGDGRIAALYTFVEPLAEWAAPEDEESLAAVAAQRYVDLWTERNPAARRPQLDACFAPAARLVTRTRTFRGRDEIAAMVDAALADPRGLSAGRTTAIEVAGTAFRFATIGEFADGSQAFVGEDAGEIDGDGRIAVLYAFAGRLRSV